MTDMEPADIFFVITSVAVICVTAVFAVALYFVILILREIRIVMLIILRLGSGLEKDITEARAYVKREGDSVSGLVGTVAGFLSRYLPKRKVGRKAKDMHD